MEKNTREKSNLSKTIRSAVKDGIDSLECLVVLSVPIIFLSSCHQKQEYYKESEKPIERIYHSSNITELKYGEHSTYYKKIDGIYKKIKVSTSNRMLDKRKIAKIE